VERYFLSLFSGAIALCWLGCGGASAQLPGVDPDTQALLDDAHWTAHDIDSYHYYDDEESPLSLHCWGNAVMDKLRARYIAALASGNTGAAFAIGLELGHLGEELATDEWYADDVGGYPWCFCDNIDDIFRPHTAFIELQAGLANYRPGVEDFTGNSRSGFYGAAVGITFPATQYGTYGIVKFSGYDFTGSTTLFSPGSGSTAKTNGAATFDMGLGRTIYDKFDAHASVGFAVADEQVTTPLGRASKLGWGFTGELGVGYAIDPLWSIQASARYITLQETNFNPSPGVNIPVRDNIFMYTIGVRRVIGSTVQ
jgi:hypothetical protein